MNFFINLIKNNLILSVFIVLAGIITVVLMATGAFSRELKIVKTVPEPGIIYSGIPYGSIQIYFSEEIDERTVRASISPQTEIITETINDKPNFFLKIYPKTYWEMNQEYAVAVEKTLSSLSGAKLKNDFKFNFSYQSPPGSEQQGIQGEDGIDFRSF